MLGEVSFGLTPVDQDEATAILSAVRPGTGGSGRKGVPEPQCAGLGQGPGGQLVRSCLVSTGLSMFEQTRTKRTTSEFEGGLEQVDVKQVPPGLRSEALPLREGGRVSAATPRQRFIPGSLSFEADGEEINSQRMFMALLLNDTSAASPALLKRIESHRWSFKGAPEFACQGRGFSFFIWCLMELQQNIQMETEGDALDSKLVSACRSFVGAQNRQGRMGDMYQILTHFISNSVVFHEWDKYLRVSFEDSRANQETFLVPRLEQIWLRFQRLRAILEGIFGALDERFVWKHRLPKIGELLQEHMRKRCFSSDLISRNELFQQANVKDETLKQVKLAFGYS